MADPAYFDSHCNASGNWEKARSGAQAVAYHARRLGIPATIVMPVTTAFVNVKATEALGAAVILGGETLAQAQARAEGIAVGAPRSTSPVEVRDAAHAEEIFRALTADGYQPTRMPSGTAPE